MANYAVINSSTGFVENVVVWDGKEEWAPPDGCIVVETDVAGIGWHYADGIFTPPPVIPPTPQEIKAANTNTRDWLLSRAAAAIAPLQDAVDLEDATDQEVALLKKWKQYRVAVNRIDLSTLTPNWPAPPA